MSLYEKDSNTAVSMGEVVEGVIGLVRERDQYRHLLDIREAELERLRDALAALFAECLANDDVPYTDAMAQAKAALEGKG